MRGQGACFGVYSGKKVTLNQKFPIVSMYVDVEARVPRVFRVVPAVGCLVSIRVQCQETRTPQ